MLSSFLTVILTALHLVYSAWKILQNLWNNTLRQYESAFKKIGSDDELKFISRVVKKLDKVPAHLAIIIVNERVSYNDLANVIIWCVAARVSFLSIYDHKGVLKRNEMKLHSALLEKWKEPPVIWGNAPPKNGCLKKNGVSNGFSSYPLRNGENWSLLQILLLSPDDGRVAFTEMTRRMCENVKSGKLKSSQIDEELMDTELKLGTDVKPIDDPELAVWCGEACCNCGFLPWHIRFTQFLHLQTHHGIRSKDFFSLLERYSKCQQRFGK